MSQVKVAVIGCGFLGKWHVEKALALPEAELVAIVDPQNDLAREKFPKVNWVANVAEVMDQIDAAVISSPTSTHFDLCQELIKNNKHVLVEKPMTATLKEALVLEELLKERRLVVQVGHSERFHPVWERVGEFSEYFEHPTLIRINRQAPFKGRATDVDVIQDLMIHDLDLLIHLFPEFPLEVESVGNCVRTDKWDQVTSVFKLRNGGKAIVSVGRNYIAEERLLEVNSSAGTIRFDLLNNKIFRAPKEGDQYVIEEDYQKADHLFLEQEEFYRAILNQSAPPVSFQDGLAAVRLVEQVRESLELEQTITL